MGANSRLTIATHALSWMAFNERQGAQWTTSEEMAGSVRTNPVVIRRLMGDLRRSGIVESRSGAGAGWKLAKLPKNINLATIGDALGSESAFAMHRNEPSPICPVAQGIRPVLAPIYDRVDEAVRRELERTTLDDLLSEMVAQRNKQMKTKKGDIHVQS